MTQACITPLWKIDHGMSLITDLYILQAPHNTFNYYFSGVNTQSDRFWLDPSTGQIYVRRILSGETQNTFTVS